MAITDIYNSLTFGEINSLDYGVYISGPAVYNAPTRDVELVSVPGRNGAIEIDKGHWNNIEVTYKAGTFGDDQSDFATKINAFRNAIVSQIGYQRITDTYNPEEYRLGIYLSGLSVNAVNRNEAGEFDLVFNCKPQRYLIDGETPISVSSGDTITNPTLYESGPLIAIEGFGHVDFNGYDIDVEDVPLGEIELYPTFESNIYTGTSSVKTLTPNNITLLNVGDTIEIKGIRYVLDISLKNEERDFISLSITDAGPFTIESAQISADKKKAQIIGKLDSGASFEYDGEDFFQGFISYTVTRSGEPPFPFSKTFGLTIDVLSNNIIRIVSSSTITSRDLIVGARHYSFDAIIGDSTQSALGHPTYIDCEIGDAYKIENDKVVDLNSAIALGSDLPKLDPGENDIAFDNTITSLEITPRWWEL